MIWFSRVIDLSFKFQAAYTSFMTISTQMTDPSTSSSAMSSLYQQFNSAESEVISVWSTMIDNYDIFMDLIILQTTYFVKNLFQILFAKLRNKKLQIITPEIWINFASFTASVYLFWRWKFYYQNLSAPIPKYWTLYVANETFNDPFLKGAFGAGLVVSLQWWRVFFILQASRTFGPLIEILLHMLKELFKFIAIYGLIFTVFISAGMCMFFNYSEFSNDNWRGFLYLFSVSLGNFDFSLFTQNEEYLERQYGWVYLVLFLVFTNIILINFLIAILSNKYSEMELNKKVLYNRKILEIKQVQAYDKYYSSLISSFAPLNLLILPFVPFLVICKSQRLNTVLLYASYIPMAFFGVLIFTIGKLFLESWIIQRNTPPICLPGSNLFFYIDFLNQFKNQQIDNKAGCIWNLMDNGNNYCIAPLLNSSNSVRYRNVRSHSIWWKY